MVLLLFSKGFLQKLVLHASLCKHFLQLAVLIIQRLGLGNPSAGNAVNNPDATLYQVLADAAAGHVSADKITEQYQLALRDQKTQGAAVALTAVVIAGAVIAPEVYAYFMFGNPVGCTAVVEAVACGASGTCDNLSAGLPKLSQKVAAQASDELAKLSTGANAAADAKLNRELLLDEIIDHSYYKHVLQQGEFGALGIRTTGQLRTHISQVIENPSSIRYYRNGREVYLQESTKTVVIRNPKSSGQSTAFQPRNWDEYISTLPKQIVPYK